MSTETTAVEGWFFDEDTGEIERAKVLPLPRQTGVGRGDPLYVYGEHIYRMEIPGAYRRSLYLDLARLAEHGEHWAKTRREQLRKLSAWLDDQGTGRR